MGRFCFLKHLHNKCKIGYTTIMKEKIKRYLKEPKTYKVFGAILAGSIIISVFFFRTDTPQYETAVATRKNLTQEISVTGRVQSATRVHLAFEGVGKITSVSGDVGDIVKKNQLIVEQNAGELKAQLSQAYSQVQAARASLNQYKAAHEVEIAELGELLTGTRPEEISIAESKVLQAQHTYDDAVLHLQNIQNQGNIDLQHTYGDVENIINTSYTTADDAINKQIDTLFLNDNSIQPKLSFSTSNASLKSDVEHQRIEVTQQLVDFQNNTLSIGTENVDKDIVLHQAQNHLTIIRSFLTNLMGATNSALNESPTTLSAYKTDINTARENINNELTIINNQIQNISTQKADNTTNNTTAQASINDAENALAIAQAELKLKEAGATKEQIIAQEAQINKALANVAAQKAEVQKTLAEVQNINAKIDKKKLISPIDGLIVSIDAEVGEIVAANTPLVSIISTDEYTIEAHVAEVDIADIAIGNNVQATLDAHGPDTYFKAIVTKIDPAETILDGVPTYTVTFSFEEPNELIRSGMTANLDITTKQADNVISIPRRAIIRKNNMKVVRILDNKNNMTEIPVKVGVTDTNNLSEITEGIREGDVVIVSIITD